jgi:hypothetical protein
LKDLGWLAYREGKGAAKWNYIFSDQQDPSDPVKLAHRYPSMFKISDLPVLGLTLLLIIIAILNTFDRGTQTLERWSNATSDPHLPETSV